MQGIELKDLGQNIGYYGLEGSIWVERGTPLKDTEFVFKILVPKDGPLNVVCFRSLLRSWDTCCWCIAVCSGSRCGPAQGL